VKGTAVRSLISNIAFGVYAVAFVTACLACTPFILFKFAVDWVGDRILATWPDSDRARAVRFWVRLLAPVAVNVVMLVILVIMVGRIRELQQQRG